MVSCAVKILLADALKRNKTITAMHLKANNFSNKAAIGGLHHGSTLCKAT